MSVDDVQPESAPVLDGVVRADGTTRTAAYLPAATVQSHAANLAVLPDGTLACVWFGGTQEGVSDISVWISRLAADGSAWSQPERLSDDETRSEQNPVLFTAGDGDVWLLYTAQVAGRQDEAEVRRRVSRDGGATWEPTTTLFPADEIGGVFVRQTPVVAGDGALLVPIFRCVPLPGREWVGDADTSSVMRSTDGGATWTEIPVPDSVGAVHMNVHALGDAGAMLALYRSRWADAIHASRSDDHGATWTAPEPTELPNNNSSVQWTPLADGRLAVVYNHVRAEEGTARRLGLYDEIDEHGIVEGVEPTAPVAAEGAGRTAFWGTPRAPMSLATSDDDGATWTPRLTLDDGPGSCLSNNSRDGVNRELSYPSILQTADGAIHVAYTYWRQAIKHVRIDPSELDDA